MHSKFNITAPDTGLAAALQHKIDQKTKPLGALGQLEQVAKKIGLIQQRLDPEFEQPYLLVFAGDHGAAKAGVSAYPQDVTWQMVENFLAGGAAINVFARQNELHLAIIDAGVAHDFGRRPGLIDAKLAPGTANYIESSAMSAELCAQAIERGAEISRNLAANRCNLVSFGEMGIGNTASASLLTHCLTGTPLADCIGRGTGLDDAGLARKQALLEQALKRYRTAGGTDEPLNVLAEFGGFEIAMMAGAMLGAAEAKMTLLIDGFIVGAAVLTAARLAPALLDYCVFCHRSAEPGHAAQLQALGVEPLLDLGLRLGEGTGAALAYPLVRAALSFLNDMASFESAGVSEKNLMLRRELEYFFGAIRFFTRLPVPGWVGHSTEALNRSARYFPAVGLLVGGIGALVFLGATQVWPQPVAVLLSMAATIYATGAFHEDGLSDSVDGLGGGWDKLRILEIMKDSRVGSYGVVAMVLALLGKFTLLSSLDAALVPYALLAGHALSRFCATVLLATMDYVREDLLSKAKPLATRLSPGEMVVALAFVLAALALLPPEQALAGCALAALATLWLARKFGRWLGGYTGDCLGAVQQVSEIAFFLGLLAHWPA